MSMEEVYKLLEEVEENVKEVKEEFDEVIDLTENSPDFSILMLRKENIVIFHCIGGYTCKTTAIVFDHSDDAIMFSEIIKKIVENFGGLGFDIESFISFIKNSFDFEVVELNK